MLDRISIDGNVSVSVVDGSVVELAIVLVGAIVEVNGVSVVTGANIVVNDDVLDIVVDDDVVDDDNNAVVDGIVGTVTVVCSTDIGCNMIGAGIITCTMDGDACIPLFGIGI